MSIGSAPPAGRLRASAGECGPVTCPSNSTRRMPGARRARTEAATVASSRVSPSGCSGSTVSETTNPTLPAVRADQAERDHGSGLLGADHGQLRIDTGGVVIPVVANALRPHGTERAMGPVVVDRPGVDHQLEFHLSHRPGAVPGRQRLLVSPSPSRLARGIDPRSPVLDAHRTAERLGELAPPGLTGHHPCAHGERLIGTGADGLEQRCPDATATMIMGDVYLDKIGVGDRRE